MKTEFGSRAERNDEIPPDGVRLSESQKKQCEDWVVDVVYKKYPGKSLNFVLAQCEWASDHLRSKIAEEFGIKYNPK